MSLPLHGRARRFFWKHPEWWSLLLAAGAWVAIALRAPAGHGYLHQRVSLPSELADWCLMVIAMMVPLALTSLRWAAFQSFRHRRHRAVLLVLLGLLAPWVLAGVAAAWLRTLAVSQQPLLAAGMFALAALWVWAPLRTRALLRCHRTAPLAPQGWRADRDCLGYGVGLGAACVGTCAVLMLACALTGHSLAAMLGGTALGLLERYSFRQPTASISLGALLLAAWFALPH